MLSAGSGYSSTYSSFRWLVPKHYNIAADTCDKWADGSGRLALIQHMPDGQVHRYSFDQLKRWSDALAAAWQIQGLKRGDRIGILLAQGLETALAHLAAYKIGAIAMPLFTLFGTDALMYRLNDSGACALVTDQSGLDTLRPIRHQLTHLQHIYSVDASESTATEHAFWPVLESATGTDFQPAQTRADDPAVLIYTSGTTGSAKGALHAHRVLLGHLPGVEMSHNFLPRGQGLMWTPADWAWIGGLLDVLLPAWHHGMPVLAHRFPKFDAQAAWALMSEHGVTHTFLPPTALKMLRRSPSPRTRWPLQLQSIASGGESLGAELLQWARQELGITINEFYGQTECNMIVSSCSAWFPGQAGKIGKPVPGHRVAIVDETGQILPVGSEGHIAVQRPDPVMFLEYWQRPEATNEKFVGDWLLTGDKGMLDEEGYIRFVGRNDDVITSAGYRIGPGPIEDGLLGHHAVALAAVIGVPDPERTEVVKAFIVLKDGVEPSDELIKDIQEHIKRRVAAHEYPRIIEFVDSLPMTATGKVIRHALRQRR
ncbi:acyl-CoA synthetase [Alcaligenes sp. SDU_A2]|uniref:acyl-CoA synthetase n=1 Tax=Alcaligenes sp. SDU_A2 TaxID=3136634 RepID=UPI00311EFC75